MHFLKIVLRLNLTQTEIHFNFELYFTESSQSQTKIRNDEEGLPSKEEIHFAVLSALFSLVRLRFG